IPDFALQVAVLSRTTSYAAEVEAEHGYAGAAQSARQAVDHLVVHRAAEEGVGMTDYGAHPRFDVFGLFEECFEIAGRTHDRVRLDAARQRFRLTTSSCGSW